MTDFERCEYYIYFLGYFVIIYTQIDLSFVYNFNIVHKIALYFFVHLLYVLIDSRDYL